jgi:hypothetical protein
MGVNTTGVNAEGKLTSANGSEPAGWVVADDEPDDADDEHAASSSRTAPMTAARVRLM